MPPPAPRPSGRRLAAAALLVGVTLVHGLLGLELGENRLGEGAADRAPKAIDVAFVRELSPSLPPVAVATAPVLAPTARVIPAEPAASAVKAEKAKKDEPAAEPRKPEPAADPEPTPLPLPEPAPVVAEAPAPASAP
ncbi:MAG TPA: hypothetical protein VLA16_24805, partial [Ideonella sp.]|nr:hypothetical protein [Ideonella sp.]